jgi:hypothetical protein
MTETLRPWQDPQGRPRAYPLFGHLYQGCANTRHSHSSVATGDNCILLVLCHMRSRLHVIGREWLSLRDSDQSPQSVVEARHPPFVEGDTGRTMPGRGGSLDWPPLNIHHRGLILHCGLLFLKEASSSAENCLSGEKYKRRRAGTLPSRPRERML